MPLFMVVEHYRDGKTDEIYARFRQNGRMMPDGLDYVNSWVTLDRRHCYQVMYGERALLDQWISKWDDLVDFDVVAVMTSAEAAALSGWQSGSA